MGQAGIVVDGAFFKRLLVTSLKRGSDATAGLPGITLMIWLLALPCTASDPRLPYTGEVMPWLHAVGKLSVPGQRQRDGHTSHYIEDCSATLVGLPGEGPANTLVTAWHCLELYKDLSRPIVFTAISPSGLLIQRNARRLADGGGMHADWAILRLEQGLSPQQLSPLQPHPALANPAQPVTMAGYSRDQGIGSKGEVLTFDPECNITGQTDLLGETDCIAHKGASGGAVVQLSTTGEAMICGIISQGNGDGRSTYIPLHAFKNILARYLE